MGWTLGLLDSPISCFLSHPNTKPFPHFVEVGTHYIIIRAQESWFVAHRLWFMHTGVKWVNLSTVSTVSSFCRNLGWEHCHHPEFRLRLWWSKLWSITHTGSKPMTDAMSTEERSSLCCFHWVFSPLSWWWLWHLHLYCGALGKRRLISVSHLTSPKRDPQKTKESRWHFHLIPFFSDTAAADPFLQPGPLTLSHILWFSLETQRWDQDDFPWPPCSE